VTKVVPCTEGGSGIRDRPDPDIVAPEGLHESLGQAVALRAFILGGTAMVSAAVSRLNFMSWVARKFSPGNRLDGDPRAAH
jgi:hypothetical protein